MDQDIVPHAQFAMNWLERGDNWIACFEAALEPEIRVTGRKFDDSTAPFIEIYTVRPGDCTRVFPMLVLPLANGTFLILSRSDTEGEEVPPTVLDGWVRAAGKATEMVDRQGSPYEWTAIIGPPVTRVAESRIGVACEGLAMPGRFGPFSFTSTGLRLTEFAPSAEQPSYSGGTMSSSVPILVSGTHRGHSWDDAAVSVARDLNRACSLLSVAWGFCVSVRQSPEPLENGIRRVPDGLPWQDNTISHTTTQTGVIDREIPIWANAAWAVMAKKPWLVNAIAIYHEGMKAEYVHPSLALVAFIASIEAVSQRIFKKQTCSECGNHRHIAEKYKATLRLVLSDEEAEELGEAYS